LPYGQLENEWCAYSKGAQPFHHCWPHYVYFCALQAASESKLIKNFCIACVLLPHTEPEPSLLPHMPVWLSFYRRVFVNARPP